MMDEEDDGDNMSTRMMRHDSDCDNGNGDGNNAHGDGDNEHDGDNGHENEYGDCGNETMSMRMTVDDR